jgi:Big-like domain-containing protein
MQRITFNRIIALTLAFATVAAACSNDSTSIDPIPNPLTRSGTTGGAGGADTSGNSSAPTPPTSNGPVASVRVTPQQAVLPVGYYLEIAAVGLDAAGQVVANKVATYRSSDANIVTVTGDTGMIVGKALGTAKIYATIDDHVDSATVTVVPAPEVQPSPSQPGVASFDLVVSVSGALAGADTSRKAAIAGALVKLTRVGTVTGDTLMTSVDGGSGTTDASGLVSFTRLTGGAYTVDITPPAGSSYDGIKTGFAPPHTDHVNFAAVLPPKH